MLSSTILRHCLIFVLVLLQFMQFSEVSFAKTITKKPAAARKIAAEASKGKKSVKRIVRKSRATKSWRRRGATREEGKYHRRVVRRPAAPLSQLHFPTSKHAPLRGLSADAVFVSDVSNAQVLYAKDATRTLPIASITKLMTALVVIEAKQPLQEIVTVTDEDVDRVKYSSSRLPVGSSLTRADMLHIALMSSENRAASALGRNYPGGKSGFVQAMNTKARALGMINTRFVEPTGLSSSNVSTPQDLVKLVIAAARHPLIREYSTYRMYDVEPGGRRIHFRNTNRLISNSRWEIDLQKTGFISEAGRCLVMQTEINGRDVVMVLLNAKGKYSRARDANLLRNWLERNRPQM